MTTDKTLLELAAKAAGWTGWRSKHGYWNLESPEGEKSSHCHDWLPYDAYTGEKLSEPTFSDALNSEGWNPLTDDGDALRLAVKLHLLESSWLGDMSKEADPYAATRRAIVRAAAEIGESM